MAIDTASWSNPRELLRVIFENTKGKALRSKTIDIEVAVVVFGAVYVVRMPYICRRDGTSLASFSQQVGLPFSDHANLVFGGPTSKPPLYHEHPPSVNKSVEVIVTVCGRGRLQVADERGEESVQVWLEAHLETYDVGIILGSRPHRLMSEFIFCAQELFPERFDPDRDKKIECSETVGTIGSSVVFHTPRFIPLASLRAEGI